MLYFYQITTLSTNQAKNQVGFRLQYVINMLVLNVFGIQPVTDLPIPNLLTPNYRQLLNVEHFCGQQIQIS